MKCTIEYFEAFITKVCIGVCTGRGKEEITLIEELTERLFWNECGRIKTERLHAFIHGAAIFAREPNALGSLFRPTDAQRISAGITLNAFAHTPVFPYDVAAHSAIAEILTGAIHVSRQALDEPGVITLAIEFFSAVLKRLATVGACSRTIDKVDLHAAPFGRFADLIATERLQRRNRT